MHINIELSIVTCKITTRMRGNAQLDSRPLLPPSEYYWVVNASPVNYDRWVGQNPGPIFSRLCTKVQQIKFACVYVFATRFADWRYLVAFRRYSRSRRGFVRNRAEISCFWAAKFRAEGAPNFWPTFINLGHHRICGKVCWRSAKRPRRLGGEKIYDSSKTEWPAACIAGGGHKYAVARHRNKLTWNYTGQVTTD